MTGPTRVGGRGLFVGFVAMFLLAVLAARFLLEGDWGWIAFGALVPPLVVILALRVGLVPGLLLVGLFATATLALRALVTTPAVGVVPLLVVPPVLLALLLSVRVARQMRSPPTVEGGRGEEE